MSNKPSPKNAKVCNHKPGDKWDDGCCGNEAAKSESSEIVSDPIQKNQVSNEQDDTSINSQK